MMITGTTSFNFRVESSVTVEYSHNYSLIVTSCHRLSVLVVKTHKVKYNHLI